MKIDEKIHKLLPEMTLPKVIIKVEVRPSGKKIALILEDLLDHIRMDRDEISNLPQIMAGRKLYRAFGKDPTRYRLSLDSLLRRVTSGKGLYQVNNLVDLGNYISLKEGVSLGLYDYDKISGPMTYRLGRADEAYEGIGRGPLNIENLPVLADDLGPFGSATSDSLRTMVTEDTTEVLVVFYDFAPLAPDLGQRTKELIQHHGQQE